MEAFRPDQFSPSTRGAAPYPLQLNRAFRNTNTRSRWIRPGK